MGAHGSASLGCCAVQPQHDPRTAARLHFRNLIFMPDRNKIAQELTDEALDRFISELAALPKKERRLQDIKHKAAELGITVSLMSAKAFRDTTFERYLVKVQNAQRIAQQVEDIDRGGSTLADASAKLLSKRIFDQLLEAEDEDSAETVDLDQMSLAVARLRRGNVQQIALEAKLSEMQRIAKEREEKNQQAAAQLEKLRDPTARLNETERIAILDEVDRLMGVKS